MKLWYDVLQDRLLQPKLKGICPVSINFDTRDWSITSLYVLMHDLCANSYIGTNIHKQRWF